MTYVLDSSNDCLDALRKKYAMTQIVIDRVQRSSLLRLSQWVKAHYEINSFECSEFEWMQAPLADSLHIIELAMGSVQAGELEFWIYQNFKDLSIAEASETLKCQSTIRKYIQPQFPDEI